MKLIPLFAPLKINRTLIKNFASKKISTTILKINCILSVRSAGEKTAVADNII
jgi:hypothetical protein